MAELETIRQRCLSCGGCGLKDTRHNVVFGEGVPCTGLVFIGEGPGEQEDLTGRPFVGPAGQLLDDMLSLIGLSREKNFYICNMVKCRPPKNRDPRPEELASCMPWLREQLEVLNPKIIVCLGRISAQALIREDYRITREHGTWVQKDGVSMTAIYHPSALLRDPFRRPETFVDLKGIQRRVMELCPGLIDPDSLRYSS